MKLWHGMNYRIAHQFVGNMMYSGRQWEGFRKRIALIHWLLALKPGNIVHDCSGFNHRVKSTCVIYGTIVYDNLLGQPAFKLIDRKHNDPHLSWFISDVGVQCGCCEDNIQLCHPEEPQSVASIEEYIREWDTPEALKIANEWEFSNTLKCIDALRAGF